LRPVKTAHTEQDHAAEQRIDAEIDRILATEEELFPSSGFMASVMERVEQEAAVPAPIQFPWKRFIPGIVLASGVFGWGAVELIRAGVPMLRSLTLTVPDLTVAHLQYAEPVGGVALALGVSLASWLLSRRLAGRGGLL
jgi:hypothetical protein